MRLVPVRLVAFLVLLAGCAPGAGAPAPPSVLLVSLDTFRADLLGCMGNADGLTPNLDAFAADAVVFDHAYAQSDLTSMSHASLFTSRYPSELGPVGPMFRLGGGVPTLASVLALYGYDTAAFTAGGHLSPSTGLERGFATFEATRGLGSFWNTVPGALGWLDKRSAKTPFLLFVHTYDTHMPYLKPAPYGLAWADPAYHGPATETLESPMGTALIFDQTVFRSMAMVGVLESRSRPRNWDAEARAALAADAAVPALRGVPFGAADAAYVRAAYDGAAAYADALFGHLIAGLRARGLYDKLVIVVFGDHGEALGEDGRFGHGESLDDRILHVPLLVHVPGGAPRHVAAQVALLDVLPTLLDLTGATAPAGIVGHALTPWLHGAEGPARDVVFAEGNTRMVSARSAAGRLTFAGVGADSAWLVDLLRGAAIDGPAFATDTTVTDPAARASLRDRLVAWRGELHPAGATAPPADPKQVEQMRAHGYWSPR